MAKLLNGIGLPEQELPFIVKLQETQTELEQLVNLRCCCYGHHLPDFVDTCRSPQECDYYDSTSNLIVIDKVQGDLLGAIRMEISDEHEVSIQEGLDIPSEYKDGRMATATKFCIKPNAHMKLVRLAIFKSFFMSLVIHDVTHLIILCRRELETFYKKNLCDKDLYRDNPYRKLKSVGNIQHRVYGMTVDELYERWVSTPHPNIQFLTNIRHPDIKI